jgi:hypothetical protein
VEAQAGAVLAPQDVRVGAGEERVHWGWRFAGGSRRSAGGQLVA